MDLFLFKTKRDRLFVLLLIRTKRYRLLVVLQLRPIRWRLCVAFVSTYEGIDYKIQCRIKWDGSELFLV